MKNSCHGILNQITSDIFYQVCALVDAYIASLELFEKVGLNKLRKKSLEMSQLLHDELSQFKTVEIYSPKDKNHRGCQITFGLNTSRDDTRALFDYLISRDIIGDWREPGIIRCSPVPFYNRFIDIYELVKSIEQYLTK